MNRFLALSCMVALVAQAGSSLEALRSTSQHTRDQLAQVKGQQLSLRNELSVLSQRIETLKASSNGRLLVKSELDRALKHSQELSSTLTELARDVATREAELEAANLAMLDALSVELGSLRTEFDRQTDRTVRRGLIERMKALRSERESVRLSLPSSKVPTFETLKASDDPEVLLEQADLLRDNQEKLAKELKALEVRIAERRQEVDLDRRVQRFIGEESMFDDQDSRLRVQKAATAEAATSASGPTPVSDTAAGAYSAGSPAPAGRGLADAVIDSSTVRVTSASDARPRMGGPPGPGGDDDAAELRSLESRRSELMRLSNQMTSKAAELEKRASELK